MNWSKMEEMKSIIETLAISMVDLSLSFNDLVSRVRNNSSEMIDELDKALTSPRRTSTPSNLRAFIDISKFRDDEFIEYLSNSVFSSQIVKDADIIIRQMFECEFSCYYLKNFVRKYGLRRENFKEVGKNFAFAVVFLQNDFETIEWLASFLHITKEDALYENCTALRSACIRGNMKLMQWIINRFDIRSEDVSCLRADELFEMYQEYKDDYDMPGTTVDVFVKMFKIS